jgi:hypothetical protein
MHKTDVQCHWLYTSIDFRKTQHTRLEQRYRESATWKHVKELIRCLNELRLSTKENSTATNLVCVCSQLIDALWCVLRASVVYITTPISRPRVLTSGL